MVTSLSLTQFKSWRRIDEMRVAPITGLFGPNSSGKTSILQLLLMLKQTVESADRRQVLNLGDERSLVSLGTFRDVIYRHELGLPIRWALSWRLPRHLSVTDPTQDEATVFSGRDLRQEAWVREAPGGLTRVDRMAYGFDGHDFGMEREARSGKYRIFVDPDDFQFRRGRGRPADLPPPIKCYGFPDQVRASYVNAGFLADFELAFEDLFSGVHYLGPLREYPRRQYLWAGAAPTSVGQRGERVVDALLAARAEGRKISPGPRRRRVSLEEYVATRLRDLGLIHSFSVEALTEESNLYRVWVQQSPSAPRVLLTDVGFGVSQILPVIVLCFYVPEGSTILLEQPEIHLHPSVQARLADVFIDAVKLRGVQIIVESHSEHLLRRLQRRIAEETFSPEDAALYFCQMVEGDSQLVPLELNEFGNIVNWPEEFFGDEFGEIAAMSRAVTARKQRRQA
jgi:predicted ATPase